MGIGSLIRGAARVVRSTGHVAASGVRAVARNPVARFAAGAVGADLLLDAAGSALSGSGDEMAEVSGLPEGTGVRSIFRDDPNVSGIIKQFAIPERFLKPYFRAPKGAVIIGKDDAGQTFALPKTLARKLKLWKPARKPPISAGDWHAFQRSGKVMRKLSRIHKQGQEYAKFAGQGKRRNIGTTNYIVEKGPGDVIQFPARKKAA